MSHSRLVYMANQIGKYFSTQKHLDPAEAIADHLVKYWDPSMRAKIVAHWRRGDGGLDPDVARAVERLAAGHAAAPRQPAGANEA